MFKRSPVFILLLLWFSIQAFAQNATLYGTVKDEQGKGIELVVVAVQGTGFGTNTSPEGKYEMEVPAGRKITVVFNNVSFEVEKKNLTLSPGERRSFDITLKKRSNTLTVFEKRDDRTRYEAGSVQIDPRKANLIADPTGGIEALLKTFVGNHNELTSQYNVRGGNYDENLVYVNDFEIYRPFLVRSGQQEGLSFINADLVSGVNFSIGGFQAKYGDKMSSVLDINYRKPKAFVCR